jgi:hypothetical protein
MINKQHYKLLFIIALFLVVISCNNDDWLLYRTGQDYFPIKKDSWWKYENQTGTELVKVEGDTVINNRPCLHLLRNFASEYWVKDNGQIEKLVVKTINYAGNDYALQESWLLQYQLPFVLGSAWSESFADTVMVLGDSFRIQQTIARKVVEINDVNTPAGTFFQTYKIEYVETYTLNDSTENYAGYEWFAPGIGLVKKIINNTEQILIDYSAK